MSGLKLKSAQVMFVQVQEEGESDDEEETKKQDEETKKRLEEKRLEDTLRVQRTQSFSDVRLKNLLTTIRKMPEAKLKEQCVRAEWSALDSELDREVLMELVHDATFWADVKAMAEADLAAIPEEKEGDDMDIDTRLAQMFACFDKDNSGSIDSSELLQMLLYMGVSATVAEVKEMIRQVDKNGDGSIDLDEFLIVMKNAQSGQMGVAPVHRNIIRQASIKLQRDLKAIPGKAEFLAKQKAALPGPILSPLAAPPTPITSPFLSKDSSPGLKRMTSSPNMAGSPRNRTGSISSAKDVPSYSIPGLQRKTSAPQLKWKK